MILELGNFWRQFWKAVSENFPKLFISLPLIAAFGGKIVMKLPFCYKIFNLFLIDYSEQSIWATEIFKMDLESS